jgi:hypothetical protein
MKPVFAAVWSGAVTRMAVAVFALSACAFAVDARLLSMLPGNAEAVGGVNMRGVMSSGLVKEFMKSPQGSSSDIQGMLALTGIDLQNDIHELVFAGFSPAPAKAGAKPGETIGVGFITGRFDAARIGGAILSKGGKQTPYKGYQLFTVEGPTNKSGDVMAFLDNSTMVAGNLAQVKKVLDKAPGGLAPDLLARVNSVSSRYDLWMVSAVSPAKIAGGLSSDGPAGDAAGAMAGDFFKKVESTQGGIKLGSTINIGLEVISTSPEDATALMSVLGFFRSMVASAPPKEGQQGPPQAFVNMLNAIQMRTDAKTLTISMDVPEADVLAFMRSAQVKSSSEPKAPVQEEIKIIQ